jgi:nucleoside-diphosphate-sugar epimerase
MAVGGGAVSEAGTDARRVLVTGGSGFIGTNLVERLLERGHAVLSFSRRPPREPRHASVLHQGDVLDTPSLIRTIGEFNPTDVVHLAAATLSHRDAAAPDYSANVAGTESVIRAVSQAPGVRRCVFASSHVVAHPDGRPHERDERDDPVAGYARSKAAAERVVQANTRMACDWCIVRPIAVWGPWFDVPFGPFFEAVVRGRYFHLGRDESLKRMAYVGNVCHQIERLLAAPREAVHRQTFYLADEEPTTLRRWAELIASRAGVRPPRTLPETMVRAAALAGDVLRRSGWRSAPLTSFRLRNMRTDTSGYDVRPVMQIAGPLPFAPAAAVDLTLAWLRDHG